MFNVQCCVAETLKPNFNRSRKSNFANTTANSKYNVSICTPETLKFEL